MATCGTPFELHMICFTIFTHTHTHMSDWWVTVAGFLDRDSLLTWALTHKAARAALDCKYTWNAASATGVLVDNTRTGTRDRGFPPWKGPRALLETDSDTLQAMWLVASPAGRFVTFYGRMVHDDKEWTCVGFANALDSIHQSFHAAKAQYAGSTIALLVEHAPSAMSTAAYAQLLFFAMLRSDTQAAFMARPALSCRAVAALGWLFQPPAAETGYSALVLRQTPLYMDCFPHYVWEGTCEGLLSIVGLEGTLAALAPWQARGTADARARYDLRAIAVAKADTMRLLGLMPEGVPRGAEASRAAGPTGPAPS